MSVLRCGRGDCENIMCDRLILDNRMYICNECYDELCEVKSTWDHDLTKVQVYRLIEEFMKTDVPCHCHRDDHVKDTSLAFDELTSAR